MGAQDQLATERSAHEATQKQLTKLQGQLIAANARCDDLRAVVAHSEEVAREGFEGKERVLEDEIARLRAALTETETRCRPGQSSRRCITTFGYSR